MSFDSIENSTFENLPIELYEFRIGSVATRFTSYDEDINFNGDNYTKIAIRRSAIESTQELGKANINIELSLSTSFLRQFIEAPPTEPVLIKIIRTHFGNSESIVSFVGKVINVSFGEKSARLTCQPIQSTLKRPGLRRLYQISCPHILYGGQCRVVNSEFSVEAVLSSVSGLTIASPGFIISDGDGFDSTFFAGGYVERNNQGVIDRRFILEHDNASGILTLNLKMQGVSIGSTVTAFAGCDHKVTTCSGKFNNIENYGGFPGIPVKNPMDGTSVF